MPGRLPFGMRIQGIFHPAYERIEAPATPEQKDVLKRLSAQQIQASRLAGEDIESVLTEAPGNVVKHSGAGDQYEAHLGLENSLCEIRVVDTGHGFDSTSLGTVMAGPSDEQGRGMALMAALVDSVHFESKPEAGTIVHLVKDLRLRPDGPLERIVGA